MNCVDYLFEHTSSLKKNLIFGSQENISYQEIYESSSQVARYLHKRIGQGNCIMLISQNSSFFIIAYLGILKSGNICIPLNPSIEQNNFSYIQNKTKCSLGFFSKLVLKKLSVPIEIISEDNLSIILKDNETEHFELKVDFNENQIAEILFTSGSTAKPKGVMLTHKNIITNTNSIIQYLNLSENDIMLVVLPFFYCYGLSLLHTHIRAGGQLVLNNNFILLASTIGNIKKYNCTGFAGVPSHFQILLRKNNLFRSTKFPSLRYVTQAGGKLPNTFIKEFIDSFPSISFIVMYGQTEATARLSYLPPEKLSEKMGSLGKGIPGVQLRVVNSKGDNVLPGEIGEIIAQGENVMLGYFGDKNETSVALRDGWLYTGDLAKIDEEGYIYLTSRKKEIIKVGGKRVSPKEIEEVIDMIPGVIDCTIEAVDDVIMNQAIKATIITSDRADGLNEEFVKQFCAERLSRYKIPSIINFEKELKLSATGKKTKSDHFI
ncbi:MAG: AMP-binding protein [Bacteroidota bacterium]|nr:AMP-binding protein [Bacteroidota bacterium]